MEKLGAKLRCLNLLKSAGLRNVGDLSTVEDWLDREYSVPKESTSVFYSRTDHLRTYNYKLVLDEPINKEVLIEAVVSTEGLECENRNNDVINIMLVEELDNGTVHKRLKTGFHDGSKQVMLDLDVNGRDVRATDDTMRNKLEVLEIYFQHLSSNHYNPAG